jgi:hypothetical protein
MLICVQVFRLLKGAPQVVLQRAHNYSEIHQQVEHKITDFANRCVSFMLISPQQPPQQNRGVTGAKQAAATSKREPWRLSERLRQGCFGHSTAQHAFCRKYGILDPTSPHGLSRGFRV